MVPKQGAILPQDWAGYGLLLGGSEQREIRSLRGRFPWIYALFDREKGIKRNEREGGGSGAVGLGKPK